MNRSDYRNISRYQRLRVFQGRGHRGLCLVRDISSHLNNRTTVRMQRNFWEQTEIYDFPGRVTANCLLTINTWYPESEITKIIYALCRKEMCI